jgi:hypothetical protein
MIILRICKLVPMLVLLSSSPMTTSLVLAKPEITAWQVVVNNATLVPGDTRTFNSYNQPSLNVSQMVVFRARSRGGQGGQPAHGVYTRDMAWEGPVLTVFDRDFLVPQPNNLGTTFIEPPSFPRIDLWSDTVASRANHQPAWRYIVGIDPDTGDEIESRAGTTGIYTTPFDTLITGASNLGAVSEFDFFAVPDLSPQTKFDVFPGSPSVTDGSTIVFKGNYIVDLVEKTGVYFRSLTALPIPSGEDLLEPAGGTSPTVLIADSQSTLIPGTQTIFGSIAPPSAAAGQAVFAGFDNEENPTQGGIYLASLTGSAPPLTTLVKIGDRVPGEKKRTLFNRFGEALSFDGRFVAFWAAWGTDTKTVVLPCPEEGSPARIAYCQELYRNGYAVEVPVNQGIFVHDTKTGQTRAIAKAPADFSDFVYWNFSGRVPGMSEGDDDGELARWRSSSFVAVSGLVDGSLNDSNSHVAFKARTGNLIDRTYVDPIDGLYLRKGPGLPEIITLVATGMAGTTLDPQAVYDDDENPVTAPMILPVTEMGIEREGFRGNSLVINASMGTDEAGWAGIYLTEVVDSE